MKTIKGKGYFNGQRLNVDYFCGSAAVTTAASIGTIATAAVAPQL
ncbi:MAG: hypothetical protein ACJAYB_001563 [Psychromonas sp.]